MITVTIKADDPDGIERMIAALQAAAEAARAQQAQAVNASAAQLPDNVRPIRQAGGIRD